MSTTKKLTNITERQIADKGVAALANRPNATGQYGVGGLSAAQLKLWFDNFPKFTAQKINEIQNALFSKEAAYYICLALDEYGVENLGDLIESFKNGSFADKILKVYPSASVFHQIPLQNAINDIAMEMSDLSERIDTQTDHIDEIHDKIFVLQKAPPISELGKAFLLSTPMLSQIASIKEGG